MKGNGITALHATRMVYYRVDGKVEFDIILYLRLHRCKGEPFLFLFALVSLSAEIDQNHKIITFSFAKSDRHLFSPSVSIEKVVIVKLRVGSSLSLGETLLLNVLSFQTFYG